MREEHYMRIPSKARTALIGLAGATALAAGTMAATTGTASAAPTHGIYGCFGYGCIGKSAVAEHCSSDATTAFAISAYDRLRNTRVTLRLRYSAGCQSEWATVTDTNFPDRATFWIYDRGTHAAETATEKATFDRQWATTSMVGVAETKAQACIELRTKHGWTAPICTPFIGH
jgi:hypothetical protein